jgi:hypothetical protein
VTIDPVRASFPSRRGQVTRVRTVSVNAEEQRAEFVDALSGRPSGRVQLLNDDNPKLVKRHLREAAYELGVDIEIDWANDTKRQLVWRRVRHAPQRSAPFVHQLEPGGHQASVPY